MPLFLDVTLILGLLTTLTLAMPVDDYDKARMQMLQKDRSTHIGYKLTLSSDEKIVSDVMVKEKAKLIEESRQGHKEYFPSLSFYRSKPLIENTQVYKLIKKMPKGAALHLHDQAIASLDWLVKNVTYRDHLYMCVNKTTNMLQFKFHKEAPKSDSNCNWCSVKEKRSLATSAFEFDESIMRNISLLATDPLVTFPDVNSVWEKFMQYFGQVFNIIFYAPVFRDYFRQALIEFYDDNVQYIELRSLFDGVYDLDGTTHGRQKAFDIYQEVTKEFTKSHPDFIGAKFIMSGLRNSKESDILNEIKETMAMRESAPDFMLGYDLVGQEDPYNSLLHYRNELLYPSQTDPANPLPYFFHAGETNWQGTETDYNLIDAVLLNTTRIGHGYALIKHPTLVETIKNKGIAVEVNPISNQLLGLVKDLRNHAAVPLFANDIPVVISSDDPGTWEASPLSHDFYLAFMNMCGEDADLRALKQLAYNSIKYSAMNENEKANAMTLWESKWKDFIQQAVKDINSVSEELGQCSADSCP